MQFSVKCMNQYIHMWHPCLIHAVTFPLPLLSPSLQLLILLWKSVSGGWGGWGRGKSVKWQSMPENEMFFPVNVVFGGCVCCVWFVFFLINVMKPTTFPSISRKMWTLLLCYEEEQWRQSSSDLSKIAKGIRLRARTSSMFSNSCLHGSISSLCLALPSFLKFLTNWNGY